MTTTKRNEMMYYYAAYVVHYDAMNDATMRRQSYRDGLEVACVGRSVKSGQRAFDTAIEAARAAAK